MAVAARPSRKVLTIGIAAPTAASKFRAPPCFSAACARRRPCLAISALLAVTTDLPALRAVSVADKAGSPAPPINSTRQSTSGWLAISSGFLAQAMPDRSMPRLFACDRAAAATTRTPRPQRADSARPLFSIRRTTSAPTVPSPAIPTLRGLIPKKSLAEDLAPVSERNHVVQRFEAAFKEATHPTGSLANALFVLHHGDADKALAVFTEGDTGRDHDSGFLHHQGRKLHAAHIAERLWQR